MPPIISAAGMALYVAVWHHVLMWLFLARLSTIFIRNEYKKIVCCLIHSPKCFQLYSFFFLPCLQVSYTIVNSNFCLYVNYFLIALLFLIICWSHSRHISIFVFYNLCFSYIFLGIKWLFFFLVIVSIFVIFISRTEEQYIMCQAVQQRWSWSSTNICSLCSWKGWPLIVFSASLPTYPAFSYYVDLCLLCPWSPSCHSLHQISKPD